MFFKQVLCGIHDAEVRSVTLVCSLFFAFVMQPSFASQTQTPLPLTNASYLNNWTLKSIDRLFEAEHVDLLDPKSTQSLRQEYMNMVQEMDQRSAYDLMDPWTQASYVDRSKNLSLHIMRTVLSQGIARQVKRAEKNSPAFRQVRNIEATVQQIMQGTSQVQFSPTFRFGASTHLSNQKGSVWLQGEGIGRLSVDLSLGQSWEELQSIERRQNEFYSINLGTSFIGLSQNLQYGGSSTRFTATLGKTILPGLSSELHAIRSLDPSRSGLPLGRDEQLRINFQRSF